MIVKQIPAQPVLSVRTTVESGETAMGIAVGIVFVMTVKPELEGSLIAIVAGTILGLVTALPTLVHERMPEEMTI